MDDSTLIRNVNMVSHGKIIEGDLLISRDRIVEIGSRISAKVQHIVEGKGRWLLPGVIDGQVHFREPGLTHKGDLFTESRAAIAGGVTSIIDMPNTLPNVLTLPIGKEKHQMAAKKCLTNFGFLLGIDQQNWRSWRDDDVSSMLALTDDGLYFSGKGKLLAQFPEELGLLMSRFPETIIALHCEDESMIEKNLEQSRVQWGDRIPFSQHPLIRSTEACLRATAACIEVAQRTGGLLHILHVTSGAEAMLFNHLIPFELKRITAEVCVQNLLFSAQDYEHLGTRIKWNPSIKTAQDRDELWKALLMDKLDIITTDHAPHDWEEKKGNYEQALSGAPMIQHSLNVMVDFFLQGKISIEKVVEKMCHHPAILYGIADRGFIQEGMKADLVLLDFKSSWQVNKKNLWYKCGWSPLEGRIFQNQVVGTWVNGNHVYNNGEWNLNRFGHPLFRSVHSNSLRD